MSVNLRGYVFSKHKNVYEFADSIGWSRSKAGRIVRGEQSPTMDECCELAEHFGIKDCETFVNLFCEKFVHNVASGEGN